MSKQQLWIVVATVGDETEYYGPFNDHKAAVAWGETAVPNIARHNESGVYKWRLHRVHAPSES